MTKPSYKISILGDNISIHSHARETFALIICEDQFILKTNATLIPFQKESEQMAAALNVIKNVVLKVKEEIYNITEAKTSMLSTLTRRYQKRSNLCSDIFFQSAVHEHIYIYYATRGYPFLNC